MKAALKIVESAPEPIDLTVLAIRVAEYVAMAPFDVLEEQSFYLAYLVETGCLTKQQATDMLHFAAIGSNLYRHGTDDIQAIIAAGFEVAA